MWGPGSHVETGEWAGTFKGIMYFDICKTTLLI